MALSQHQRYVFSTLKDQNDLPSSLVQFRYILLQFFKKNLFVNSLLLLPYALFLHLGLWLRRVGFEWDESNYIFNHVFQVQKWSYELNVILSTLIIFVQALMINGLVSRYKLNPYGQLLPGLFFILMMGFGLPTLYMSPALVGNFFFIIAIDNVFQIYNKKSTAVQLFNFGFFIGLASALYVPYYIFLLLGLLGIFLLKGFQVKLLLQMLTGFINVFFLIYVILYVGDWDHLFWQTQIKGYFSNYVLHRLNWSWAWVGFGILIVFFISALVQFNYFQVKRIVLIQKYYNLLFWTCFIFLLSFLFMKVSSYSHLTLLIMPLSFIMGLLVTRIKNPLVAESIHVLFVVLALFLQFQNW